MSSLQNDSVPVDAGRSPAAALDAVLAQALAKALACHDAGQFSEAEQLCQAILLARPDHPEANYQLGLLEIQRLRPATSLPYFLAAIEACPESRPYWLSYLEALIQAEQVDTARQVLALGQQHGLAGAEVDDLALRLTDGTPLEQAPDTKPVRTARRHSAKGAAGRDGKPSAQDESKLLAFFNAGHYSEGETFARELTERFPGHGFGWKALGTLLKLQGRNTESLVALRQAADLLPRDEQVMSTMGLALADLGKQEESEACHRRALRIKPSLAEAHFNLGNCLCAQGRYKEAENCYRRAVSLKPSYSLAYCNLGNALMDQGCLAEAEISYRRALALQPDLAAAHLALGRNLKAQDRPNDAEASYRRALAYRPDDAEAHSHLGETLRDLGRLTEAESALCRALELQPDFAEAHYHLGNTLGDQGRLEEAETAWRRAVGCKPDFLFPLVALGSALRKQGRLKEAEDCLRRALEYWPEVAKAHFNLGNILSDQERLSEAEASYRRALELMPDLTDALLNLSTTLIALGRYAEAEAGFRQALTIRPESAHAHSNLLFCLTHDERVDAAALFAEHCRFGQQFEAPLRAHWTPHSNSRDPERCLQIGFLSPDFRNHAVANFIEPVLAELKNFRQLSLHAYYSHTVEDHVTLRLREHIPHWHPVAGIADTTLADRIRADGIDILIDLSGHTAHHRLQTFARKPAPLQASWIGYPGTTGLQAMDYYLADRFFLPFGEFDEQFTEKIVRLPASAPFLPFADAPAVSPLPALSRGHVTFGSFNRPTKISPSVIALWSQLLRAVPNSRMLLGAMRPDGRADQLIEDFARNGISRDRLSLHYRCDMKTYLTLHQDVDVCLDTFPYTGGTTTLHALWMGVPTLTMAGSTVPGRPGASVLGHVGLETFIAADPAEFVNQGVAWTVNPESLARLRAELRQRLRQSAMGQPQLVAAGLERALRIMWRRWCAQLPAESFAVDAQDLT